MVFVAATYIFLVWRSNHLFCITEMPYLFGRYLTFTRLISSSTPLDLVFHPIPHNVRPLYLTNKTDEHVVFRVAKLVDHLDSDSWDYLPLYGTVHPRSTCRLIVITDQVNEIDTEMDIVVQSSILGDKNLVLLARPSECHEFFDQAKAQGQAVHEVPLKFVYTPTVPEVSWSDMHEP